MAANPIISQNTARMPSSNVYFVDSPIFASTVVKLGEAVNTQAYFRSKRIIQTHCTQNHIQTWTQNTTNEQFPKNNRIHKDEVVHFFPTLDAQEILFTCSPHARWIGYYITYEAAVEQKHAVDPNNLRPAKIELSIIATPRNTRSTIDAGCIFSFANGTLENTFRVATDYDYTTNTTNLVNQHYDSESRFISSGFIQTLPPDGVSYSVQTTPRPLFIPSSYRNGEIALKLDTAYVRLNHITIFEMFEDVAI